MKRRRVFKLVCVLAVVALAACSGPERREAKGPGSTPPPVGPGEPDGRPLIVALGDSLTAGLGVDPAESYPGRLQKRLDRLGHRYRVINAGVSGDTTAQGLNRLQAVRERNPVVVIVALGANDGLRGVPVEATRKNLETIIRTLRQDGVRVILAGMLIPPNYGPQYARSFRDLFPDLAEQYGIPLVPFLLQGVAGKRELNQADGIHPTGEGYARVVDNIWPVLEPLL